MKKYLAIISLATIVVACGNNEEQINNPKEEVIEETNDLTPQRVEKAQKIFQTIPSPLETASLFKDAGANYNPEILNPSENVVNYYTQAKQALNFGVYGADLSYSNIFDQSQETMLYMNSAKKLADGLGIIPAFDANTVSRIEQNMNNRDSLMIIINDAFWVADAFLKENGQDNLSALVIVGGWIEGLYLGGESIDRTNPDEQLMKRIVDQKYSLENLIELLETYDDENVVSLKAQLLDVQQIFNKVQEEEKEVTVQNNNGVASIGGGTALSYEAETVYEVIEEVGKIRNEIVQ